MDEPLVRNTQSALIMGDVVFTRKQGLYEAPIHSLQTSGSYDGGGTCFYVWCSEGEDMRASCSASRTLE